MFSVDRKNGVDIPYHHDCVLALAYFSLLGSIIALWAWLQGELGVLLEELGRGFRIRTTRDTPHLTLAAALAVTHEIHRTE